jgi:hypothetical protein
VIQAPSADPLRPVLDSVFAAPKYQWVTPRDPLAWIKWVIEHVVRWLAGLEGAAPVAYWAIVALLVAVLVAVLVHGGTIFVTAMRYASVPEARELRPSAVRRDARWYEAQADAFARDGRYADAVRSLFDGLVLELDGQGALRWHPSKTPREYAREARLGGEGRARLSRLVDGVYDYSFAKAPCGALEWEAWRGAAAGRWDVQ